ncbi:MAG: glycerol-3-phosphate dehydrogenase, partial [Hyphomicrobiales bacterium]
MSEAMDFQKVGIVGAGAWGTGLAQAVRVAGRDVLIWARHASTIAEINQRHENLAYLPGIEL